MERTVNPDAFRTPRNAAGVPELTRKPSKRPSQAQLGSGADEIQGTIVLDNGTGVLKIGMAGEDAPRVTFPSVLGRMPGASGDSHIRMGDEALNSEDLLLSRPMQSGIVHDWDEMEKVWDYAIEEALAVHAEDYNVLLTEAPMNPKKHREKAAEIMFEGFNVPSLFLGTQAILSLYSEGMTTGVVLDVGEGISQVVPVFDGYALPSAIARQNLSGNELTQHLKRLLEQQGLTVSGPIRQDVVRQIKESMCYVALDPEAESAKDKNSISRTMTLPDGRTIELDDARHLCPEPLFQPSLLGLEVDSVQDLLYKCIQKCPMDTRKALSQNIVISGGSTKFLGFENRLQRELEKLYSTTRVDVKIIAPRERALCVWTGGSILGSLPTFEEMLLSWEEYDEVGPASIHSRVLEKDI
eukprot:c13667_g1_i1.p1 GENE.c13667_g1_i1~~c13667_g1_i1.p1  ORF type:complete len:445 (+),score=86.31 c13667_g1_i1:103-1335(+)